MRTFAWLLTCLLVSGALGGCGAPSETPLPPSPALATPAIGEATPAPILTPVATFAPAPTARTTIHWPPNVKDFVPASARIVDFGEVDTDGNGVTEMLVIYQEGSIGHGLVIRREGDNGRAYALGGDKPADLFQESWTANTVRDINGDGKVEVLVEGVVKGTATTVSVFQWNGRAYASLLSLSGSEGVAIDDPHNTGILDFTALQLYYQRSFIMRATHAEWQQTAYAVKSDVLFLLGAPSAYNYPEEVALAYYIFLDKDEPELMFGLLSEPQKSKTPLKALMDLSRSVDSVNVESLKVDDEQADSASVTLSVRAVDHATQKEQVTQPVWRLKKENQQWRLAELLKGN